MKPGYPGGSGFAANGTDRESHSIISARQNLNYRFSFIQIPIDHKVHLLTFLQLLEQWLRYTHL